nr:J349 [uncultured bacterium]
MMVSEWFQIDDDHTGRVDIPVQDVEVDEDAGVFRVLY